MRPEIVFELCVDTVEAALAAEQGGADRALQFVGGGRLDSWPELAEHVMKQVSIPVHAMIRLRGGNFLCSDDDLAAMEQDILYAGDSGCAGVVFVVLLDNRSVDIARTKHLVALASPMEVTFHRAIDEARNLPEALEDAIAAGAGRVLTSGGHLEAAAGASTLAGLVRQAAGRVHIAIGGGVDSKNVGQLVRHTGATHIHASLRARVDNSHPTHGTRNENEDGGQPFAVTAQAVRDFAEALRSVSPLATNSR